MDDIVLSKREVKELYHIADNVKTIWDVYEILIKLEAYQGITIWEEGLVKLTKSGHTGILKYPNGIWSTYTYEARYAGHEYYKNSFFENSISTNELVDIARRVIKIVLMDKELLGESSEYKKYEMLELSRWYRYDELAGKEIYTFNKVYSGEDGQMNISITPWNYENQIAEIKKKQLNIRHAIHVCINELAASYAEDIYVLEPYVKNVVVIPSYGSEYAFSLGYYPLPVGTILKVKMDNRYWEVLEGTTARKIKLKEVNGEKENLEIKEISDLDIRIIVNIKAEGDMPLVRGGGTKIDQEYIKALLERRGEEYNWFFKLKKAKGM